MRSSLPIVVLAAAALAGAHAAERPVTRGEEIVVTATRFKERYVDKPVNVTVIGAEDIRASTARTVPDLLSEQAGIAIHDFFGNNAATTTVDLRGFGIFGAQNTLILVDGRRVTDIDLSGVHWSAIPLGAIERIEIVRGGGGVLYGDGASAGVVNIITRSPEAIGNRAGLEVRAAGYGTRVGELTANYFRDRVGIHVTAANLESDGYRANNHNRQGNAQADLRYLTGRGEVALKLGTDNQGIRLPGARTVQPSAGVNQLATNRRGTGTPLDYAQREGNRATLDWIHETELGEFTIGAGYRDKRQTSNFDFGGFPDYRVVDLDVWSFTPRVRIAHRAFGNANTLVAGFDAYRWDYRLRRSNSPVNVGQPFNIVDASQRTEGYYLHHTTRATERITFTAGARRERLRITASDRFDATAPGGAFGSGAPAGGHSEWEHAHEIGLRYQLSPALALIGKTGRSYRFANVDEIYETSPAFTNQFQFLRPQNTRSREIGVEARRKTGYFRATLFELDVTDEIHLDAFTTGIGNTNLPPSRRRGAELEARRPITGTLTAGAGYTYIDARFRQGAFPGGGFAQSNVVIAGKTVPLVPRHKLNLNASWTPAERIRLNALLTYVGEQYMDNDQANTLGAKIPAYTVADLKLVYHGKDWRVSAAANNLFNEKYYNYAVRSQAAATPDRYNAYPLPERSFMLTLEYVLK
ncbi:MAG: TonB-dependent receptor [Betaproteobacteria bacterium]|nr:TonB-dependent receptor [Betaproteobacteria bacterium]